MNELARSVGLLTTQRAVLLVLGAARTKIAAGLLGPAGMGLLAQAMALRELLMSLSTLGTRSGYVKLVAEAHGRSDRVALERLIVTTLLLVGALGLVVGAAAAFASPWVGALAFGRPGQWGLVVLVAATVVLAAPAKLIGRTFTGVLDYRTYLSIAVVESLTAVAAMAVLAALFGVAGAVAAFALMEGVVLFFGLRLLRERLAKPLGLALGRQAVRSEVAGRLVRLAGALTITSLFASAVTVFVRGEILRQLGEEANGYYQVAWQVGQNYLGLLGTALWSYGMPKVATRLDAPDVVVGLQNDFLRIVLVLMAPGVLALLATREIWISVLYSPAFLAASGVVAWQLLGELVAMVRQSMNISLLPRERLRFLVFQAVLYWGSWAALSAAAIPHLGVSAVALGYLAANVVALGATYAYHHRALGFRVHHANLVRLGWSLPVLAAGVALTFAENVVVGRLLPLALAGAWLWSGREVLRRFVARDLSEAPGSSSADRDGSRPTPKCR